MAKQTLKINILEHPARLQRMQYLQFIITNNGQLTIKQMANLVSISSGTVFSILKKELGFRKVSARWISHLLTEKQKRSRVEMCRKLPKIYRNCNARRLSEFLTGYET